MPHQDTATPFICNVRADYIFHAAKARSEDLSQDALYGIRIEPLPNGQGVYIMACNGHQFIILRDASGTASRPGTVYPDKNFLQAIQRGASPRLCVTEKAVGELARPGGMTVRQEAFTHDGHDYPNFYNFIALAHNARPLPSMALPAQQLAGIVCSEKAAKRGNLVLYGTGEGSPIFVRDMDFEDYLGIIMPIKLKGDAAREFATPVPAWAESLAQEFAPTSAGNQQEQGVAETTPEPMGTAPTFAEESSLPAAPMRLRDIAAALERGTPPAHDPIRPAHTQTAQMQAVSAQTAPEETSRPVTAEARPRRIRGRASTVAKPVAPTTTHTAPAPVSLPEALTAPSEAPTDAPEHPQRTGYSFGLVIAPAYLAHFVRTPAA